MDWKKAKFRENLYRRWCFYSGYFTSKKISADSITSQKKVFYFNFKILILLYFIFINEGWVFRSTFSMYFPSLPLLCIIPSLKSLSLSFSLPLPHRPSPSPSLSLFLSFSLSLFLSLSISLPLCLSLSTSNFHSLSLYIYLSLSITLSLSLSPSLPLSLCLSTSIYLKVLQSRFPYQSSYIEA